MPKLYYTTEAARVLGVAYWRLHSLLRFDYLRPQPRRNEYGRLVWTPADLRRARRVLAARPRRRKKTAG